MIKFNTLEQAIRATCLEHNVRGCATCNKLEDECEFGSCSSKHTEAVSLLNAAGKVGEVRRSCKAHVIFMRQGAPYGVA